MFRPMQLAIVFVTAIVVLPLSALMAQDQATGTDQFAPNDQNVSRVIKLRSNDLSAPPEAGMDQQQSSRTERVAQRPANVSDPTQLQFDEIVPQATPRMQTKIPVHQPEVSNHFGQDTEDDSQMLPAQEFTIPNSVTSQPNDSLNEPVVVTSLSPQIATKLMAPKQINVGASATVTIEVQNVSRQMAQDVKLIATLPAHVEFVSAQPKPSSTDGHTFEFAFSQISARQTYDIKLNIVPREKHPIEIGTQIRVVDTQSIAVGVRQPEVAIIVSGPEQANTGQWVEHKIMVENTGDGVAENILLVRQRPEQLQIEQDKEELIIPRLVPGEKMSIPVKTFCQSAGEFELGVEVSGPLMETRTSVRALTVVQPELQISATGPNMTFVNRDGIYAIQIDNTGRVDVTDVQLDFQVPSGFEVTTVSREAQVESETGSLMWFYERIPANSQETIQLKATTRTPGTQVCKLAIRSNETQPENIELKTEVATRADVSINLSNQGGPVEVGGKTEFVITVVNKGSSVANGVEVQVELATALMPVQAETYTLNEMDNSVRFSPLDIQPGESKDFHFAAVGVSKGEHIVRGVVMTSDSPRRLIAEDSVYVFESDQSKVSESLQPTMHKK